MPHVRLLYSTQEWPQVVIHHFYQHVVMIPHPRPMVHLRTADLLVISHQFAKTLIVSLVMKNRQSIQTTVHHMIAQRPLKYSGSSRHIAVEYRAIIIVCQYPPYSLQDNMLQRLSPMALVNCEDTSPMWNIFDQNLRPNGVGLVQNIGVFHCRSATPLARSVWATRRKGLTPQPGCCVQQRHFPCLTRMENSEYRKVVSNRNERLFIIKGLTLQPPLFASHSFRHCCLWVHSCRK